MSNGPLSSVMIIAGDGLLQNQGLEIAGNLTIAINSYTSLPVVSQYLSMYGNAIVANNLSNSTLASLQSISASNFPALTDVLTANLAANIESTYGNSVANVYGNSTTFFTDVVLVQAEHLFGYANGSPDYSIFTQVYNLSQSYRLSANQMINSVRNSNVLANTFINMDAVTTGGISLMTNNPQLLGADLTKLGTTVSLEKISVLGHPWVLLLQMLEAGGLVSDLAALLALQGVTADELLSIKLENPSISGDFDLKIYKWLLSITGSNLEQVKELLSVTTPNLITAADLLNPKTMLPDSYKTLVMLTTESQLIPVYTSNGSLNSQVSAYFADNPAFLALSRIIPPDQAAANLAWAKGLGQIKNIMNLTLPELAKATSLIETNAGLASINALTAPVPSTIQANASATLAPVPGNGPNGTLTLYDFMGTLAGYPYASQFANIVANLTTINNASGFNTLINSANGLYPTMSNCIANVYTTEIMPGVISVDIPPGLPGAGSYSSVDDAFAIGLIPAGISLIGNIVANNSSSVSNTTASWGNCVIQIETENVYLNLAQIDFANLQGNSKTTTMGLVEDLHNIGVQVAPLEANDLFVAIANVQTETGQAVIASLREGRNIAVMDIAGIGVDTQLSTADVPITGVNTGINQA